MATDKPRFTITIDEATLERVTDYKKRRNIATQSKAIASLVQMALADLEAEGVLPKRKIAPPLSDEAIEVAHAYDLADEKSRGLVRYTLAEYMPAKKKDAASAG